MQPGADGEVFLPLARPDLTDAELAAVAEVLESGWLTTGPRVHAFEQAFAAAVGAPEAVAVNSCTAGLHLSLLAAGVGSGDEVVTSPFTFCATANTVIHCGGRPVFADVLREGGTLDPTAAEAALTPRTRALLPVHHAGRPADPLTFRALADRAGLALVEDAAHCVDATVNGRRIGSIADYTCFSFYATKNLATGEGGMVTLRDPAQAAALRVAALHGLSRDAWRRYGPGGSSHYDVVMAGYKYNMTDLQAALGLVQLQRLHAMQERRASVWRRYDEALASLPVHRPAPVPAGWTHARHVYAILIDPALCGWERDELQQALAAAGIGTSVHFRALHLHSYYAERYHLRRGMFPVAELLSDQSLSLPLWSGMADEDAERVVAVLGRLLARGPRHA